MTPPVTVHTPPLASTICVADGMVVPLAEAVEVREAEQVALVPPLAPVQLQFHGPEPLTDEAVPVVQRLVDGALLKLVPFDVPQAPLVDDDPDVVTLTALDTQELLPAAS